MDDDAVRAGAQDQTDRGLLSDPLGRRRFDRRATVLLVDFGCDGTPPLGGALLPYRGGDDVARRLSAQCLYRRHLDLLRDGAGPELLRQRQLLDRRTLHGRGLADAVARKRHGARLWLWQSG